MNRSVYYAIATAAFGAAFTLSTEGRADTITLLDGCSFEYAAGCTSNCTAGSINCDVQYADECSKTCVETPSKTCTTSCESKCMTNPGSFSCTDYCSGECESECSSNGNFGAGSSTDCVTACQGQCSYSCNVTPPSTTCSTECDTTCKATENISCSVKCQEQKKTSCTMTPSTCTESCNGSGGVIVCNGQVVYVASSVADAGQWYISHLDGQFDISKFAVSATGTCSGNDCTGSVKANCAASPIESSESSSGFLLAGLGFVAFGVYRRRNGRR